VILTPSPIIVPAMDMAYLSVGGRPSPTAVAAWGNSQELVFLSQVFEFVFIIYLMFTRNSSADTKRAPDAISINKKYLNMQTSIWNQIIIASYPKEPFRPQINTPVGAKASP
jgi:hypothetical protein